MAVLGMGILEEKNEDGRTVDLATIEGWKVERHECPASVSLEGGFL
jgi:hypothetical protein